MSDLVVVKYCKTRLEAQMVKGLLNSNGIQALVTADDEGGMSPYPLSPSVSMVKLFVSKKDSKKAILLLNKTK